MNYFMPVKFHQELSIIKTKELKKVLANINTYYKTLKNILIILDVVLEHNSINEIVNIILINFSHNSKIINDINKVHNPKIKNKIS